MPLAKPSLLLDNWIRYNNDLPHPDQSHHSSDHAMASSTHKSTTPQDSIAIRRSCEGFHPLVDAAGTSPGTPDLPVIPVRPPLRPTASYGSASDVSYYSPTASQLVNKAPSVSIEELFNEREQSRPTCGHDWRYYATLTCLASLNFSCDLSTTVLSTALPAVSDDLDLNTLQAFWVPGSLLLSAALLQPLYMRLENVFGSKALLLLAITTFACGSVASALATTTTWLFAGQCLQGIGVGGISLLAESIVGQTRPISGSQPAGRHAWTRSTSHVYWIGFAVGPVVGGACAQTVGWRHVFWVQILFSLISLFGLFFLLRQPAVKADSLRDRFVKVDHLGWTLMTAAVSTMTISIFWSGLASSWSSYRTWVPLTLGFTCLIAWFLYNGFRIELILPGAILRKRSAAITCFGACTRGILLAAILYFLPIFFQLMGMKPVKSGLSLAPWTLAIAALGVASGAIISMTGHRLTVWAGWGLTAAGCGLMILFSRFAGAILFVPVEILAGIGLGLLCPSLAVAIESVASNDDESSHAVPLFTYFSTLGQCIGVLAGGTIFSKAMENGVADNQYLSVGAVAYTHNAISFINKINATTLEPQGLHSALVTVYTQSLRYVWIFTCSIATLALILSICFTSGTKKPEALQRRSTPMLPELEG
ncbi:hypothetical protein DOTSEDRAFT_57602 [Dothistroma septosporum NZE10]|uniref:Major facilitator superfamily (MFS) profile domain-containing protein n=1 Tax=Dothistroma septosporum (strain NZE10 / CBS 128990) TaxID=675120 RepID=N1PC15_DOTSN|nr:hypothetical protein DOTSEDRAFT_57602 [Dothistroma septosporum NZE10]